ncbi:S-layer homology domain-containing protein [Paenibacillus sp. HW567]|uniref:S-layer homology domain-containing protein n=1 Tax=Paenibacillus sp. HW567 TaxID=1034769 RepID=UPI00035F2270|nr:S-layer homology domain-containing protein [Paenibacillus sp. HW567]
MNKKILAVGVVILMLCSLWPSAGFAADEPEFSVAVSRTMVTAGEQVDVQVSVSKARDWTAYELNLDFDPAKWSVNSDSFTTNLSGGFSSIVNPELLDGGQLRAVYTKLGNAAGDSGAAVLGKVTFTAKVNGTSSFTLKTIKVRHSGAWSLYTPDAKASVTVADSTNGTGGTGTLPDTGSTPGAAGGGLSFKAEPDKNGVASVKLDSVGIQQAIGQLSGTDLTIVLQPGAGAKQVVIEFPLEVIRSALGQKLKTVTINSGLASITLNEKFFGKEAAKTAGSLQFSVAQAGSSSLPVAVQDKVRPDAVIYDFQLKLDGSAAGVFNNQEVAVKVPYTLQPGETANKVVVYYVADNGVLEPVKSTKYDPASGSVTFRPQHFSRYIPAYADVTFKDLSKAEWARESVEALAAREAINGVGSGQFDPNGRVSRAQFITMLIHSFDLHDAAAVSSFTDTQPGAWYYTAVASAQKLGIIEGKPDGSFGVNDSISRQDLAVMLYRASRVLGLELGGSQAAEAVFSDKAEIALYASEAVAAMQQHGIVNGLSGNTFAPKGLSTRAQAAVILYRTLLLY